MLDFTGMIDDQWIGVKACPVALTPRHPPRADLSARASGRGLEKTRAWALFGVPQGANQ
jgi:hypothetical protein